MAPLKSQKAISPSSITLTKLIAPDELEEAELVELDEELLELDDEVLELDELDDEVLELEPDEEKFPSSCPPHADSNRGMQIATATCSIAFSQGFFFILAFLE
jgi:hypothetical protein